MYDGICRLGLLEFGETFELLLLAGGNEYQNN